MKSAYVVACAFLALAICVSAQDPCTSASYAAQYTQCNFDLLHDLLYYKKPNANCTGGVPVPDPIFSLPCNITCDDGQYLPLGATTCSLCASGSYTSEAGVAVSSWNSWPRQLGQLTTFCQRTSGERIPNCNGGWYVDGSQIRSGPVNDSQISVLQLTFQAVNPGHVHFNYRANAELRYDGIMFLLDDVVLLPKTWLTTGFVSFTAPFTVGFHTIQWWFYKDVSISQGEDAVFVNYIEVVGTVYSQTSCLLCPPGTFAGNPGTQTCSPCPANTFSTADGATSCTACDANQYSFQGSTSCFAKRACTANDYAVTLGPCSGGQRVSTPQWLQPQICDATSFPLPAVGSVVCNITCSPGTYKDTNGNCQPCASGTFSNPTQTACLTCPAGNYSHKVLSFHEFNSWPSYASTSCQGNCGNPGWRLRGGFLDSGSGHGQAVSYLYFNVTLETAGPIAITYQYLCTTCQLTFTDFPFTAAITLAPPSPRTTVTTYVSQVLEPGYHSLYLSYIQQNQAPAGQPRNESVRIYSIVINGASVGGGATCPPCADGSVTSSPSSSCQTCPLGSSSVYPHTQCTQCAGNTFTKTAGSACYPCGPNTVANADHTDCFDNCKFNLSGVPYDINSLDYYWGPLTSGEFDYYIQICWRGDFPSVCADEDGNPLEGHICQYKSTAFGIDAGWLSGYVPLQPSSVAPYGGFVAVYDLGLPGCSPSRSRTTNVTFICDTNTYYGTWTTTLANSAEPSPCFYSFTWRSLFACPVCTSANYNFVYTACVAGTRQKRFSWTDPKVCHDGVSLPATQTLNCTSGNTVVCPPNQYLSADGTTCTACAVGSYVVSGGALQNSWPLLTDILPTPFTAKCDSIPCTTFTSDDGLSIHSGTGSSTLSATVTFVQDGTVSFYYKLYQPTTDGAFQFSIDKNTFYRIDSTTNVFVWTLLSFPVPAGQHIISWSFVNGIRASPSLLSFQGVYLKSILFQGSNYNTDTCTLCPPGTFSNSSNPATSQDGCTPCPQNTFSFRGSSSCVACAAGTFSFPRSSACTAKPSCTNSSYSIRYTDCVANSGGGLTRTSYYVKLLPDVCTGTPPGSAVVGCAPCPFSTSRTDQDPTCRGCAAGSYFNGQSCIPVPVGNIALRQNGYFVDTSLVAIPDRFTTGCSGLCGSDGWRLRAILLDPGNHGTATVDSWLSTSADLVQAGSISFVYFFSSNVTQNGLQFLLDGDVYPIPLNDAVREVVVNIPLSVGHHTFLWNYHQDSGTSFLNLRNIVIVGEASAIATIATVPCPDGSVNNDPTSPQCQTCPAGTAAVAGSTSCTPCAANQYNPVPGQGACQPCGFGSSAVGTNNTRCATTCKYNFGGSSYDLTDSGLVTIYDNQRNQFRIRVCDVIGADCPNSHVCVKSVDGTVTEIGNDFTLTPQNATSRKRATTPLPFAISFANGAVCPGGTNASSSVVNFQCDTTQDPGTLSFVSVSPDCVYTFTWQTINACPACDQSADYDTLIGVCSGGNRQVSYTRNKACNGPLSLPTNNEGCSSAEFPTGAVIAVVIVFVAVVLVAGFVVWRNRRLAQRYNSLIEETRSQSAHM